MTQKSLTDAIKEATSALEESNVPEDLREVAFSKALDSLLGLSTNANHSAAPTASTQSSKVESDLDAPMAAIATRLRIPDDVVSRVFDVDDDGVHLIPPRSAFAGQKKKATQEVALLIAAARQAAGIEDWTEVAEIRKVAEKKGVLDSGNFASQMSDLDGHGLRLRGERSKRELKMNDAGYESAGLLAAELISAE
ncbi:MAG: hypothetical protein JHC98_01485 [Thermoleophilaceae bacterium]|nr:hypothetical protein [Thermoleophilaceae bacterium]